jgi:glycerol-3-phosphate acyltransferase PlsY
MGFALPWLMLVYLFAGIPMGLLVAVLRGGLVDPRDVGSGNIGATNMARAYGRRVALTVLLLDAAKGLLPVLVIQGLAPGAQGLAWITAFVAFVAHCAPIWLAFRGGKGVATAAGALLALAPLPTLGAAWVWAGTMYVFGRSSFAALMAVLSLLPLLAWLQPSLLPLAALLAAGMVWTHRGNLQRAMRGEELPVREAEDGEADAPPVWAGVRFGVGPEPTSAARFGALASDEGVAR